MKKLSTFILCTILVFGFIVRLYRFNNPIADWHSFRQSDTNAVSQIFVNNGINLLYPKYFDISNVQSGKDNPKGYRFVEFPLYNAVQVLLFKSIGWAGITLEESGRLISILATLAGSLFIYLLTRKYAGNASGFFSALFYLFLPFSIFYGRTVLPDELMATAILGGIYFFDIAISKKNSQFLIFNFQFWLAILFTASSFLLKPYALFFTLPFFYLAFQRFGIYFLKKWQLFLFLILSTAPLVAWRFWIGNYQEGIPVSAWLFNGNGIRFRPSFFRWIFYERITRLILGYAGVIFLSAGIFQVLKHKNKGFFISFLLSSLIYLFVMATGNVQHDYYQILIIPTLSMFSGIGVLWLYNKLRRIGGQFLGFGVCVGIAVICFLLSWNSVRDFFNINDGVMVKSAYGARKVLPKDALIIAPYDGSTTFLNLIQRQGWPVLEKSVDQLSLMGAEYLVLANPTKNDFEGFGKQYKIFASSSSYLILQLKK
ncbi:MAG: hypothetical protein AUK12_00800 [Candidatus Levybacteria bacterium CG2_30_37_29]|nr:MAG: hypothetical protein AUK12_00800 [Candidatus Levybacteria bacterium CG2_30_37_29]